MKSRITTFFMIILMFFIIAAIVIFSLIFLGEFSGTDVGNQIDEFVSKVTSLGKDESNENVQSAGVIETQVNELETAGNGNTKDNNYEGVEISNKYFYEQLNETSKTFYRAFEQNKENMKSGTYQIEFGNTFYDVLSKPNGDSDLGDYYQSAVETYLYDNPDIFYLDVNKMYLNIETITKGRKVSYNVFINSGNENSYLEDGYTYEIINQKSAQIQNVVDTLLMRKTGNVYNDIKMIHDYIIENVEYDLTISEQDIYNIYGTLVKGKAVCEGYAKSFQYFMNKLGIPSVIVIGEATNSSGETENHAWNYVQINNVWYAIDTTWDDPVVVGGGRVREESKYRYFLKGENTLNEDHFPSGQFTQGGQVYTYPDLSLYDYE